MAQKVLALTEDGRMTWCSCPPELRGKGRCNHIGHQNKNESVQDFLSRCHLEQQEKQGDYKASVIDND